MLSDHERRDLYNGLEGLLGPVRASYLMDLLPPTGWADVARQAHLLALEARLEGFRAELKGDIAALRGEMLSEIGSVRGDLASLKNELASVKGSIYRANFALAIGVAGLVLAAARLA
jgi:hypothetical protein